MAASSLRLEDTRVLMKAAQLSLFKHIRPLFPVKCVTMLERDCGKLRGLRPLHVQLTRLMKRSDYSNYVICLKVEIGCFSILYVG